MSIKVGYIVQGDTVINVVDIGHGFFIPAGTQFKYDGPFYTDKDNAMYAKLLRDLQCGKPLKNFKASPYYTFYLERLAKDHLEYLI